MVLAGMMAEVLTVNFVKARRIGEIVQINIRGHNLTEIHSSFFEIIEKIAHGLPEPDAGSWWHRLRRVAQG